MKLDFSPRFFVMAVVLAVFVPTLGHAAEKKWEFNIDSPEQFEEEAAQLRQSLAAGEYANLSDRDRRAIEADLNRLGRLLNKRGDLADLGDRDQIELMNAQERIHARLSGNNDDRMVCKLEAKTGTRMKTKRCLTVSEWAMVQAAADRVVQDIRAQGTRLPSGE